MPVFAKRPPFLRQTFGLYRSCSLKNRFANDRSGGERFKSISRTRLEPSLREVSAAIAFQEIVTLNLRR